MAARVAGGPYAVRLALAFLSGLGLAVGQVPLSLWFVALPALAVAIWLVATEPRWRHAAGLGLAFGAGHFGLALNWITEPFQVDAARDGWMAPFALVFLAIGLGLFWAAAAGLAARTGRAQAGRALAFALALATAEIVRGHILTGFPWVLIGHIWLGSAPEQVAALIGAYGLTVMTLAMASAVVVSPPRGGAFAVLLLASIWGFGLWRSGLPVPDGPGAVIRVVQPNAAQHLKWDPAKAREFMDRQLSLTAAPAGDLGQADLVIWPETAVSFLLGNPGTGLERIVQAAGGAQVALGIQRVEGWRGFNSLALIGPQADIRAVYDKHHLVPFGEYVPLGDLAANLLGITAFAAQEGFGYTAGAGPKLLDLGPLGRALPLICYEAVFPQDIRRTDRADWMLHATNDAWFGDRAGPYQHLSLARLRAIEQGLPLVRAANTGVSAVIDARGRVLAQIGLNKAGYLDVALPGALTATPYARWGEVPVLVALALLWASLLIIRRRLGIDPAGGAQ
ncbi:MAG: apolipoprotein N-acyltransferase [Gemmobacter sp.]|nr:apolipoprotein N-acyltransferase [Gemmobacter sp.]